MTLAAHVAGALRRLPTWWPGRSVALLAAVPLEQSRLDRAWLPSPPPLVGTLPLLRWEYERRLHLAQNCAGGNLYADALSQVATPVGSTRTQFEREARRCVEARLCRSVVEQLAMAYGTTSVGLLVVLVVPVMRHGLSLDAVVAYALTNCLLFVLSVSLPRLAGRLPISVSRSRWGIASAVCITGGLAAVVQLSSTEGVAATATGTGVLALGSTAATAVSLQALRRIAVLWWEADRLKESLVTSLLRLQHLTHQHRGSWGTAHTLGLVESELETIRRELRRELPRVLSRAGGRGREGQQHLRQQALLVAVAFGPEAVQLYRKEGRKILIRLSGQALSSVVRSQWNRLPTGTRSSRLMSDRLRRWSPVLVPPSVAGVLAWGLYWQSSALAPFVLVFALVHPVVALAPLTRWDALRDPC